MSLDTDIRTPLHLACNRKQSLNVIKMILEVDGVRSQGQNFTVLYALTVDAGSFRLTIAILASDEMILVFIDASNAIQKNVISDPNKRVYIILPTMYLDWFRAIFPNYPLAK